jgi:hypothetical protein
METYKDMMAICHCAAAGILIDDLRGALSEKWQEKALKRKTIYRVVKGNDHRCVGATSRTDAAALYYEIEYDPEAYSILTWRWRIDGVLAKSDATRPRNVPHTPYRTNPR